MDRLYHFSEDPSISVFEPHVAKTSALSEAYVWAIDEWHAPMYYVPRNCPRACFWAIDATTDEDRERFVGFVRARFVMAIESGWIDRLRETVLYRYVFDAAPFRSMGHGGGHWVTEQTVAPLSVEPVGDLLSAIAEADVELRVTPRLGPLWHAIVASTLEFSGTRLRYALGFPEEFPGNTAGGPG